MTDLGPKTKIVVGLGNPGDKYVGTRHNVGFDVLNHLAQQQVAGPLRAKFEGQLTSIKRGDTTLILVWPLTYMNNSGRCTKAVANFYKVNVEQDLLVVCDDLSLPVGKLRMRAQGSAGGQKGLNDILKVLGTQAIARLRIGIDAPPPQWETADYVLGKFRKDEAPTVELAVATAADAVLDWCVHDINYCMNRIN
ncbi:MAG: aminoacyl-tRNA hydrolase [Pirellulaceae bacterium]